MRRRRAGVEPPDPPDDDAEPAGSRPGPGARSTSAAARTSLPDAAGLAGDRPAGARRPISRGTAGSAPSAGTRSRTAGAGASPRAPGALAAFLTNMAAARASPPQAVPLVSPRPATGAARRAAAAAARQARAGIAAEAPAAAPRQPAELASGMQELLAGLELSGLAEGLAAAGITAVQHLAFYDVDTLRAELARVDVRPPHHVLQRLLGHKPRGAGGRRTQAAPPRAVATAESLDLDDDLQQLVHGVVGGDQRAAAVSQLPLVDALADGLSAADAQQLVRQCLSIAAIAPTDSATFDESVRSEMDAERLEEFLSTSGVAVEQLRRGAQPAQMRTARLRFSAALRAKSAGPDVVEPSGASESASAARGELSGLAAEIIHGLNPSRKATSLEDEAAAERLVSLSRNPDAVAALKELGGLVKSGSDQATIASKAIDAQRLYPEVAALLHHEGLKIPETGADTTCFDSSSEFMGN